MRRATEIRLSKTLAGRSVTMTGAIMPIRAEERDRYPADWPAIAKAIKDAADWTCVGSPAFPDCRAKHGEPHPVTGSKVIITVAHLDHTPENVDP